jgi:hypothetical protein
MTIFTRRQIETTLAAILAAITAVIGISSPGEEIPARNSSASIGSAASTSRSI